MESALGFVLAEAVKSKDAFMGVSKRDSQGVIPHGFQGLDSTGPLKTRVRIIRRILELPTNGTSTMSP